MIKNLLKSIWKTSKTLNPDIMNDTRFLNFYSKYKKFTMTSIERMYALYMATDYLIQASIPGDIVECGVWKGGSIMLSAEILNAEKEIYRRIYLYDTFEGMTKPGSKDIDLHGKSAESEWWQSKNWRFTNISEANVKNILKESGFDLNKFVFVKGDVLTTLPAKIPQQIALLRLDTDWYASTKHELIHLFPRIVDGGVLIIDDYGHFLGAREAVDEYIKENNLKILLHRIDYSGRIAIINKI